MQRATKPAFKLEGHLFFWLTQVIGARDRRLVSALKEFGLRVPEYRALAALYARRRCSMSELADLSSIDRTTLTRTVDRMQDAGWVTRLADAEDMRVIRLALTAAGEKLFARIWPAVEALNRAAMEKLSPATVEMLYRTLAQMKANLEHEPAAGERAA
jgi:DNA-binding MarR family transcriptional regulator